MCIRDRGRAAPALFDQAFQHLLPIDKEAEIGAFVVVAYQITVQAHGAASGGGVGNQIIRYFMVLCILMSFANPDD